MKTNDTLGFREHHTKYKKNNQYFYKETHDHLKHIDNLEEFEELKGLVISGLMIC